MMASDGDFVRSSHSLTGDWVGYIPKWTASTTNPVIGNGLLTGRYKKVGRTVLIGLQLVIGSSTTLGEGFWQFSLPVEAAEDACIAGAIRMDDLDLEVPAVGDIRADNLDTGILRVGTIIRNGVDATTPFAWNEQAAMRLNGVYQAAS